MEYKLKIMELFLQSDRSKMTEKNAVIKHILSSSDKDISMIFQLEIECL